MNRDRKLIFLTVLYFAILGCFLLGCSEGTDSSPVSALMGEITAEELQGSASKITGLVLNSSTNEGIPNILVKIIQEIGTETVEVKSDLTKLDGSFTFSGFNNGTYTINVKDSAFYSIESRTNDGLIEVKNGIAYPQKNFIYLKYDSNIATDTFNADVYGNVKHSDGSAINATASLYLVNEQTKKDIPKNEKKVLSTDGYFYFNVEEPGNYFILIRDELAKENPNRIDFVVLKTKEVKPNLPINHTVLVKPNEDSVTIAISIDSAYTGAPLELATVKINGENQGTTDKDGKLTIASFPLGIANFEISKEGFETLTTTKSYEENGIATLSLTMIEDTKDGYGSITGRYVNIKDDYSEDCFVRLYRLIERTQTSSVGNKSETWYDVDKSYILTTKTKSGNGTGKDGSFKLTHIEPGNYQIYISKTGVIPVTEQRSQVYDDFQWTQLKEIATDTLILTQPLKVVSDQTTYWTNYEQGNN